MRSCCRAVSIAFIALTLGATTARATDGRIEINQAGLVGFPYVISSHGGYVLTSNITVPNFVTSAIRVDVDNVSIDLNGFLLDGPVACTPMSCNSSGGIAIDATGRRGVTVHNGLIRQFGGGGIAAGDDATIRDVTIHETGGNGISLGARGRVEDCHVTITVGDGINTSDDSVISGTTVASAGSDGMDVGDGSLVRDSVIRGSASAGLRGTGSAVFTSSAFSANGGGDSVGAKAVGGSYCLDQSCSRFPMRRFYLTEGLFPGNEAATQACAAGFHMASLWEIFDPSGLLYDTERGFLTFDSGQGPINAGGTGNDPAPALFGWVRTGTNSEFGAVSGSANCDVWSSNSVNLIGTIAGLTKAWNPDPSIFSATPSVVQPWSGAVETCDNALRVWCVEDR